MQKTTEIQTLLEEMKKLGVSTIEEYEEILKQEEELYCTVESASAFLTTELGKKVSQDTTRNLIRSGEIEGKKESNKTGYRILKSSLEKYVKETKMTKEDYKLMVYRLEGENEDLKEEIKRLKEELETLKSTSNEVSQQDEELLIQETKTSNNDDSDVQNEVSTNEKPVGLEETIKFLESSDDMELLKDVFVTHLGLDHDDKKRFDRKKKSERGKFLVQLLKENNINFEEIKL